MFRIFYQVFACESSRNSTINYILNCVNFCLLLLEPVESLSADDTMDTLTQSTGVQWCLELPKMTLWLIWASPLHRLLHKTSSTDSSFSMLGNLVGPNPFWGQLNMHQADVTKSLTINGWFNTWLWDLH